MRVGVVLMISAVVASGAPAMAKTVEEEVQELSNDAIEAYKSGRYQLAVEDLTRAYAIRPLPALLYNLGKAYDKLGDVDKAYDNYKKYVDSGEAEPKLEEKAKARMQVLEPQLKPKTPPPVVVVEEKPKGPTAEELAQQEADRKARARTLNLVAGIGVAALGLGGIGAGIGLYASASSLHDQFGMTTDEATKRQLRYDAQTRGVVSSVMYAVGGVLIAGSFWFFYAALIRPALEERDKPADEKVSIVPWLGPQGAGVGASWRF